MNTLETIAVIPAYNEERTVGNAVRASLRAQSVDAVILVNDGSHDNTKGVAQEAALKEWTFDNAKLFTIEEHAVNRGKAEAMQTGAEVARTLGGDALQTLVFLDADLSSIRSRETQHNRYLWRVALDKLTGETPVDFDEEDTMTIQEDLFDLLSGYINDLVEPVAAGDEVMSIGLLARNQLSDRFRTKLDWGMLAGSRAVSVELWDSMLQECAERGIEIKGWEIEAALNSYTRLRRDETGEKLNRRIGKVFMTDVVHVGSRYKAGGVAAGIARMTKIHSAALKSFAKFAVKL